MHCESVTVQTPDSRVGVQTPEAPLPAFQFSFRMVRVAAGERPDVEEQLLLHAKTHMPAGTRLAKVVRCKPVLFQATDLNQPHSVTARTAGFDPGHLFSS